MRLNKYIKPDANVEMVTTSVTIEKTQLAFLKKLNLNLSKLVRDTLDQLIQESKKRGEK